MRLSKRIKDYMTPTPLAIDMHASIEEANAIMLEQALRHLPVERDGKLVGVISDRDLVRVYSHKQAQAPHVGDVMTVSPYIVGPEEDIRTVAEIMASNRLGCVLVRGPGEKLAGIFTTTDALVLLAKLFDNLSASAS